MSFMQSFHDGSVLLNSSNGHSLINITIDLNCLWALTLIKFKGAHFLYNNLGSQCYNSDYHKDR